MAVVRFRRAEAVLAAAVLSLSAGCASFHSGPLPGEPQGARFEAVEGARVHYVDVPSQHQPEAGVVLLLHGFAASLRSWRDLVPVIAEDHRVIALDLKGFGWTDRPDGDYSPVAQARLAFGLLDRRGVDRPVKVVAHSWGSSVALQMAISEPRRVDRLALYDAWVYEDQLPSTFHFARASGVGEALYGLFYTERLDDKMATAFFDARYVTEERVERIEEEQARPGTVAAALAATRGQRFDEVEARYPTIQHPTLLLWGREDRITPLAFGERLVRDLPNAELVVYPRCGHFPMIEAAEASTRDLLAFLRGPSARATPAVAPPSAPLDPTPSAPAEPPAPAAPAAPAVPVDAPPPPPAPPADAPPTPDAE